MTGDSATPSGPNVPSIPGYDALQPIGRGGFATVYRAREPAFNRDVAIKVLETSSVDEEVRQRFQRECQAVGSLSAHPSIVTVFAAGSLADGRPYMVMEFMEQGSLAAAAKGHGATRPREVAELGLALLDAIGAAHQIGIVHRDIKPDNVLISRYGKPQLADFGISSIPGGFETRSSDIAATVAFAAPEVIDGERATTSSDLYSLATTLATLLIGRAVFGRTGEDSLTAYISRILRDPVPDLTAYGASPELDAVLRRAMAKTPADRFSSASEFRFALARVPDLRQAEPSEVDTLLRSQLAGMVAPMPGTTPVPALPPAPAVLDVSADLDEEVAEKTIRRPVVPPQRVPEGASARAPEPAGPPPTAPPRSPSRRARKRGPLVWVVPVAALALAGGGTAIALTAGAGGSEAHTHAPPTHSRMATTHPATTHPATAPTVTSTCQGLTCHFAASGADGASYTWDFGDGSTQPGGASADHTYAKPGSFSAVASSDGASSTPVAVSIASFARAVALTGGVSELTIATTADPACGKDSATLQQQGSGWSSVGHLHLGSGSVTKPSGPGTYRVVLGAKPVAGGVCAAVTSGPATVTAPSVTHAAPLHHTPVHAPAPPAHKAVKQYNAVHP